jgi:hypothetical protein
VSTARPPTGVGCQGRWYRGPIVRGGWRVLAAAGIGRRIRAGGSGATARLHGVAATLALCALLAGCGGTRQDAHEAAVTYRMEVLHASFPVLQSIASPATMRIVVRNSGLRTVPNVAVTVDSFSYVSNYPELSSRKRPIWAVDLGPGLKARPPVETQEVSDPGSGGTAYVDTWSLGPLPPGRTQLYSWHVVALKPGLHVVHYRVAAGLAGKARAISSQGSLQGHFKVYIAAVPPPTHVDPNTGRVEPGAAPSAAAP